MDATLANDGSPALPPFVDLEVEKCQAGTTAQLFWSGWVASVTFVTCLFRKAGEGACRDLPPFGHDERCCVNRSLSRLVYASWKASVKVVQRH